MYAAKMFYSPKSMPFSWKFSVEYHADILFENIVV